MTDLLRKQLVIIVGLIGLTLITNNGFCGDVYKTKLNPFTSKMDYVNKVFVTVPSTPTSACDVNTLAEDDSYLYICVGTNQWMRTALAIWTIAEAQLLAEPDIYLLVEPGTYLRTQ